jgi:transcriptional regulator with XRE-family HTH domain
MRSKDTFRLQLGRNLRRLRTGQNLTIETLALETGLAYSQISRIELGKINTTAYTIHILAQALNADPGEFFRTETT